jgi:GH24 family phage-related lysozyme (muramidase)
VRQLNNKGLNLIKKLEGTVPFVYLCQAGYPTIGCGHLCKDGDWYLKGEPVFKIKTIIGFIPMMFKVDNLYEVKSNIKVKELTTITDKEIDKLLKEDVGHACRAVEELITVHLNDNQFAALVSFTFNLGRDALQRSTLRRKLNNKEYGKVPAELNKWVYANGKKLDVLVKRREEEGELFMTNPILV